MLSLVFAANWWEPGQAGYFDIGDASALLMFVIAAVGAVFGLSKWWMRQLRAVIRSEIEEFTAPIQPTANGGNSLPDVSRRVEKLENMMQDLQECTHENRDLLLKIAVDRATN